MGRDSSMDKLLLCCIPYSRSHKNGDSTAKELGKQIEAGQIQVSIKMGEGGKAFGSVSSKEIAEEVKKQLDLTIDKKKVQLKEAIKVPGTHVVPIKLHPKVTADLKVLVTEEA